MFPSLEVIQSKTLAAPERVSEKATVVAYKTEGKLNVVALLTTQGEFSVEKQEEMLRFALLFSAAPDLLNACLAAYGSPSTDGHIATVLQAALHKAGLTQTQQIVPADCGQTTARNR